MIKRIVISIMLLVSLVGISGFTYFNVSKPKIKETKNEIQEGKKDDNDIIEEDVSIDEEETETPKEEEEKIDTSSNNTTTNSSSNSSNINTTTTSSNKTTTQSSASNQETPKQEPVKETGPWDAWGMTKEQYYNEPLHSWERVDFKASSCGSETSCLNACTEKGDTYEGYLYSCDIITSASGNFLGVMLDLEKLN